MQSPKSNAQSESVGAPPSEPSQSSLREVLAQIPPAEKIPREVHVAVAEIVAFAFYLASRRHP